MTGDLCPNGGKCADPGNPSDCLMNGCIFSSPSEKEEFDALPDLYQVRTNGGEILKFKNQNQAKFYLTDFGGTQI